ncbi:RNA polymerase sigma factor [Microbacterium sp. PMB16]|uniref:RNA polymerase sigma factor n=1 Tax=Microbacterium sp. PMB16 TaxID=3120157 RepID=UPI003F4B87D2
MTSIADKQRMLTAVLHDANVDILRYLHRRVGGDAPDLFGETLLVAWRRIDDLPTHPTEIRMWLFGLARGTLLNHARGERRRLALVDRLRSHVPAGGTAPAADEGSDVRDAIARLRPEFAEIVQLVHWEGFTLAETATIIGIPAATVRSRYARAKEDLRAALGVTA